MKYLFRGGTVVSGRGTRRADILVEGEKIVEVGRNITRKADQIIDVTGMLLMPGFIDAHTHFAFAERYVIPPLNSKHSS